MATFRELDIPFLLFEGPISHAAGFKADSTCECCGNTNRKCFSAKKRSANREPAIGVCYQCLREGKAGILKVTEFGMVGWLEALRGLTNGVPGLRTDQFETERVSDDDGGWYGARVPSELLLELLRTPNYTTWQGSTWLFCCSHPMCFIGEWAGIRVPKEFATPKAFFDRVISPKESHSEKIWERLELKNGAICLYVFRCTKCGNYRSHWDMS